MRTVETITRHIHGDFDRAQAETLNREFATFPAGPPLLRIEIADSFVATLSAMDALRHAVASAVQRKIPVELACAPPLAEGLREAGLHLICDIDSPSPI